MNRRSNGILLHPTSLSGKYGIGTFGKEAIQFIDFMIESGIKVWQILPLGHTGFGNSPYQCFSAYAGNPLLIDFEQLLDIDFLSKDDLKIHASYFRDGNTVDFDVVNKLKIPLLRKAYQSLTIDNSTKEEYQLFCQKNAFWLNDYALFMSLKEHFEDKPWFEWTENLRKREVETLNFYQLKLTFEIGFYKFCQYIFSIQWLKIKKQANQFGIKIMGDIPIYVSQDSSDVWAHPSYFMLDEELKPTFVAGVPPDYFSETGQFWGNPVYNWNVLKKDNFRWWVERIKFHFELFDMVRIDHFRGFSAFWSIPANELTAINGKWLDAPGMDFFKQIEEKLGKLEIIAEDLGVITPEVEELRETFDFPGMKILQFAFSKSEENPYLPHNYSKNCVVYTGTHDNDTTKAWLAEAPTEEIEKAIDYMNSDGENPVWDMIRLAWSSVANMAIAPAQDFLELDSENRMNTPGTTKGNWKWKLHQNELTDELAQKIKKLNILFER